MLSERFIKFAEDECKESSILYENLVLHISQEPKLLSLFDTVPTQQPVPNIFLGAVHFLLLKGYDDTLLEMYHDENRQFELLFDTFDKFCLENKEEIRQIMKEKRVQTNGIRRTAYIYPLLSFVSQKHKVPISLVEIGTSAGLHLLVDQYRYSYEGIKGEFGEKISDIIIHSKVIKGEIDYDLSQIPEINQRVGIDLNILDLKNESDYLWMKALIWPNHSERIDMLESVKKLVEKEEIIFIEDDVLKVLRQVAERIAKRDVIFIFHTHVANQMTQAQKDSLIQIVDSIGKNRIVYHVYNNIYDNKLRMEEYIHGARKSYFIGETAGHGEWFEWRFQGSI